MTLESQKMSPELQKFFKRLMQIKNFVKEKCEETQDKTLCEIYEKLHELAKEKDEQ